MKVEMIYEEDLAELPRINQGYFQKIKHKTKLTTKKTSSRKNNKMKRQRKEGYE